MTTEPDAMTVRAGALSGVDMSAMPTTDAPTPDEPKEKTTVTLSPDYGDHEARDAETARS